MTNEPRARDLDRIDAMLRSIEPEARELIAVDDDFSVSLACYEALYADFRTALRRRNDAEDANANLRAKLRNALWLLAACWIVAAVAICWRIWR